MLPGEIMRVFILREGKEYNQGVAYLDDGTMVVVDGARRMINKTVDITVTSVHQTTAGKMIFGRLDERLESQGSRPAQAHAINDVPRPVEHPGRRNAALPAANVCRVPWFRTFSRTGMTCIRCAGCHILCLHGCKSPDFCLYAPSIGVSFFARILRPMMNRVTAILPAAGLGTRMGAETPKQFLELDGVPVLLFTLRRLAACPAITDFIICHASGRNGFRGCQRRVAKILAVPSAWFAAATRARIPSPTPWRKFRPMPI